MEFFGIFSSIIVIVLFCLIVFSVYKCYKWIVDIKKRSEEVNKELTPLLNKLTNAKTPEGFIQSREDINNYFATKIVKPLEGVLTLRLSDIDEDKLKKDFEKYKAEYVDDLLTLTVNMKFSTAKNVE